MPALVSTGGGPPSGKLLSNRPVLGASSTCSPPLSFSTGVQWIRSVEMAKYTVPSPQYIQYLPSIFAAISRPLVSSSRVTIPADFDHREAYLPPSASWKADPYFVQ